MKGELCIYWLLRLLEEHAKLLVANSLPFISRRDINWQTRRLMTEIWFVLLLLKSVHLPFYFCNIKVCLISLFLGYVRNCDHNYFREDVQLEFWRSHFLFIYFLSYSRFLLLVRRLQGRLYSFMCNLGISHYIILYVLPEDRTLHLW